MDLGIRNRIALVTGSSKGIGKAIALKLAEEGAQLVICARNTDQLNETAQEIEASTGVTVLPIQADLNREEDIKSMVERTVERYGSVDILVNNTGGPPPLLFLETSKTDWKATVETLLMSVIICCREVVPHMKEQQWGRIINVTSFTAKQPSERLVLSNTIRAGVLGLTKTLSNELAEFGILVNALCPGWTLTKRVKALAKNAAEKTEKTVPEVIAEWASSIPLKRLADPEEIANLVTFLASEKASYITGAVIQVDGGLIRAVL